MGCLGRIFRRYFLASITLTICHAGDAFSQTPDSLHRIRHAEILAGDTSVTEHDRRQYEAAKKAAEKRKWTDVLYSALFSEPKPPEAETTDALDKAFEPYDGLVIGEIDIVVLAPFGTDIRHPDSVNVDNRFDKAANSLHFKTKQYVVRSNLLFKKGDAIDPLIIAESEAFLRSTGYIHDARIQVDSVPHTNRANVTVIVRDVFSVGIDIHSLSLNTADIELFDKNFLGIGSRFWIRGIYESNYRRKFGYGTGYRYTNLSGTFIDLEGSYLDRIWITETSLSAERSPRMLPGYYGQANYYRMEQRLNVAAWDSINPPLLETFSISFGKSFNPFGRGSPNRLSAAVRYIDNRPSYAPVGADLPDPMQYELLPARSLISRFSFYSQRYYREYMIHNFGITENIASGYNISTQIGYTKSPDYFEGAYTSLEAAAGKEFPFGNLYARAAVGSHFDRNGFYQGVVRANVNYFTPLLRVGNSRLRQFVNINYANTLQSLDGITDYVYFSTLSTMRTSYFDGESKGSERFMVNLETDYFTTLNVIGFRVLLFSFFDGGWLKTSGLLFDSDNFRWGIGVGLRVRNDLLVFRTLVLKVGYYPSFNQNAGDMLQFSTTEPMRAPNFIPTYPQEITLN